VLGKEIAALLGAKGGGAKGFFQGKAPSLGRRAEAVAKLVEATSSSGQR